MRAVPIGKLQTPSKWGVRINDQHTKQSHDRPQGCPANDLRAVSGMVGCGMASWIYPAKARLRVRVMPSMVWWTLSPLRRQSRRIFQVLMRAKTCSTRAHTCAGPYLLVGLVVFPFPVRRFGLASLPAVRSDESGARVAAVGDREGLADRSLGFGLLPCLAVVAAPGQRSADQDDHQPLPPERRDQHRRRPPARQSRPPPTADDSRPHLINPDRSRSCDAPGEKDRGLRRRSSGSLAGAARGSRIGVSPAGDTRTGSPTLPLQRPGFHRKCRFKQPEAPPNNALVELSTSMKRPGWRAGYATPVS